MKQWMLGIVLTAFAGGLARQLAPKGREEALVRLVSGLLLTLVILQPLGRLWGGAERWEPALEAGGFARQSREQAACYQKKQQQALANIIAEKCEAYIWDKADQLGLACRVTVTTAEGDSGIPLPDTVTVRGPYSEALAACIEEEVGIPAENVIWLEERAWTETKESGG